MTTIIEACIGQHLGDRQEQQDRVILVAHEKQRGIALAVVADGMGGHTGGALAAEQAVHTVRTNFQRFSPAEEAASHLGSSLAEAHNLIRASRAMNEMDPHSTVVALLLQPGKATWVHGGDSRLYRFRGDRPVFRTTDHSYVEQLVKSGKLTPQQALVHPNRNILLSSLGGNDEPYLEFGEAADLAGGDTFLLCSDGLWACFGELELGEILAAHPARQASEILIGKARERSRGEGDNVSLAIIKLHEAPKKKPAPAAGFQLR